MRSNNRKGSVRIERLISRVDIELAETECLCICPCKADGVKLTELASFAPSSKETSIQRRDRKTRVLEAIQLGRLLPIDIGITAGYIRFVINALNEQEEASWLGKATGLLDASSGFLAVQEQVIQLPADKYQASIFCYVPNRSAVARLTSDVADWEESSSLVDNLKMYWKSTRKYKSPWTNKSLKDAVAVIVQLAPSTRKEKVVDKSGKIEVTESGSKQFALAWSFRTLSECPDLIEPFPMEVEEENDEWEIVSVDVPKPRKSKSARKKTGPAPHPIYPILFADEDLGRFREQLLGCVLAAQEARRFEAHQVVPRLTASTLKEFDYLAEDSLMYPRLMLVIACTQIECGYIEPRIADEAIECLPTMKRTYQLELAGAQRKKALSELNKLREEIEEFRDI